MQCLVSPFAIVDRILRDRTGHFAENGRNEGLIPKVIDMLTVTLLGLGLFGAAMGLTSGTGSLGWCGEPLLAGETARTPTEAR